MQYIQDNLRAMRAYENRFPNQKFDVGSKSGVQLLADLSTKGVHVSERAEGLLRTLTVRQLSDVRRVHAVQMTLKDAGITQETNWSGLLENLNGGLTVCTMDTGPIIAFRYPGLIPQGVGNVYIPASVHRLYSNPSSDLFSLRRDDDGGVYLSTYSTGVYWYPEDQVILGLYRYS